MYNAFFKQVLDFFMALGLVVLLSPLFLIITIISTILNGKPFFTQKRPGKNEKVFTLLKFKTMTDEKDHKGMLLADNQRLTKFGVFLRKTSLDEIPQLINVIKGDMSFIGPRPLLIRYLPYYAKEEKLRHSVKPGITGLAQISGRNFLTWEEKFTFDVRYVKNLSFRYDVRIFFKTITKVLKGSDIAVSTHQITEDFDVYRKKQIKNLGASTKGMS